MTFIMLGCQTGEKDDARAISDLPTLNLTHNALWDDPVLKDQDRDEIVRLIGKDFDDRFMDFRQRVKAWKSTVEEMQLVYDTLASSQSIYAGYLRLTILNRILVNTPFEKFDKAFVTHCLQEGYKIAEGDKPVPQSTFFDFWDNCMVGYTNVSAYDEVFQEEQKLLEICEKQNIPMGVMFAYLALANNLQDHSDYSTAMSEYAKADSVAQQCFSDLITPNWMDIKSQNVVKSPYLTCYVDMKSQQLYCSIQSRNYEWIKANEQSLWQIVEGAKPFPSTWCFMLNNMAQYYDATGQDSLYQQCMSQTASYTKDKDDKELTYGDMGIISWNSYTLALHELKLGNPAKALAYMDNISDGWRTYQDDEIYAKIYMQMGNYKEAAERLLKLLEHNKQDLDGHNRLTLTSMSANIENKKRDMQLMQSQIEHQHMLLIYNGIILALAFILIVVLGLYLHHRNKKNKQLAIALDKAEVANKAKNSFLRSMTHEIRTPLNGITGFVQLLQPSNEEEKVMVDEIRRNSSKLKELVDTIIAMSEYESDSSPLPTAPTSVLMTCLMAIDRCSGQLKSGVTMGLANETPEDVELPLNGEALNTILHCLVDNAVKFTDRGSITLDYRHEGQRLMLSVTDTGKGIPAADRERVFGRFVKLDEFVPGFGLGLSLVRSIVQRMGGDISIDPDYTSGTRVRVSILCSAE